MNWDQNVSRFADARFGLFLHFGLYSMLGRGEWVLNREMIPEDEYRKLSDQFKPDAFDADDTVRLAQKAGARYVTFTTMHHDGFALYDSDVISFNSVQSACERDLVAELVDACRRHGMPVHLYHSLNCWLTPDGVPDGADALENSSARDAFVDFTHARIEELLRKFDPIDCLWYDGWWPFDAAGWRSEDMHRMVRRLQPHVLVNGRNGLPGDFATPEQHLTAPKPWRPWEACVTHNTNWGFHRGDQQWKPTWHILNMLTQCAAGGGNLLLNIGPSGDGAVPGPSVDMLHELGEWLSLNGESIYGSELLSLDPHRRRKEDRTDWMHHGPFTAKGQSLYAHLLQYPGRNLTVGGVDGDVRRVRLVHSGQELAFSRNDRRLVIEGLPEQRPHSLGAVVAIDFNGPWSLYLTGGLRTPDVPHPRYDPVSSDLPW